MNIGSFSTWCTLLLSSLAAMAFAGDDDETRFYLASPQIYSPEDTRIAVEFGGQFRKGMTLQMNAYRILDPVAFFLAQPQIHSPVLADSGGKTPARRSDVSKAKHYTSVASWTTHVDPETRYWHRESIPVPVKEKGVYLVTARNKNKEASTVIVITELGMITKQSPSEALAFVVNRKSGQKVTGIPLQFVQSMEKSVEGTTGSDGVARVSTASLTSSDDGNDGPMGRWRGYQNNMVVLGEKDGNLVISDSYFYAQYGNGSGGMSIYLHTDRPVYRPAQEVNFRGIARQITSDGTYRTISDSLVSIEVTDARGASVKKDTMRLSDFGTFSGSLTLGDEPPLGQYHIKVSVEGSEQWFNFTVEEYKKPEYEVKVITDREQYTRGEKITASIKADYYFGSPVAEGTVEYMVFRSPYYRPWWYGSEWAYLYGDREMDYRGRMEMVHNGTGKLAADGTFKVEYQTDGKTDADWVYTIQANVVDNSRRSIAGSASVKVTRGEFYITTWTDRYVYKPEDVAKINVKIARFADETGVAAPFTVTVKRTWWEESGRRHGGTSKSETILTGSGSTDGNGNGEVTFKPTKAGYFTIEVKARDSRGTDITTSTSVYVADETYAAWYQEGSSDFQIIPDKALYTPGETMSALVIAPQGGFDLITTLEGATIYRYSVERLSSSAAIVRIPIEEKHAPMVYVQASAIYDNQFHSAEQRISVIPKGKKLRIEVTTDKKIYKPGEKAKLNIRALTADGEPAAPTDIALGMVDEAIYAIRPDQTPDITAHFYGIRHNSVSTGNSLNFNFYWNEGQVAAPMMASGAGAEMSAADASVGRSANREMKMAAPPAPPPPPEAMVEPTLRTEFKDLMYWTPSVRTGRDGRATIDVTFPDNLTTWRITARGVTQATAVGQTTAEVTARKDLLVRMETPRFLTEGDELLIATTVHNYLSSEKKTKVEFSGDGITLEQSEQTVTIPANGEKRIDWKLKAPKVGQARMQVRALTNEESDAMELKIPILPRGLRLATSQMAGIEETSGSRTLTLEVPVNTVPGSSTMTLAIAPSAASSIIGALDALIGYPYGCVEQTMSRFLPTVVVADALKKIDVPFDAVKREEMPKMVAKGFERLGELQHNDGGWGWWTNDETNPFMTAYVMYGMQVAADAGHHFDPDRFARGLSSLRSMISSKAAAKEPTTFAYMLYVASFIGSKSGDRSLVDEIASLSKKKDLNNYGKALLALAALQSGDKAMAGRIATELESGATTTDNAVFWKGSAWHYQWQDDQVETTAYVVKALLAIRGETDQVGKAVQWLLRQKEGDSWHNTRQTAMTIYALVDYVQKTNELDPSYDMKISINGQQVFTHTMTKADVFAPERTITVDPKMLRLGNNSVTIEKSGRGKLYASARLVYYATGDAIKPASAGFSVTREYFTLTREKRKGSWVYTRQPFRGTVKSGDEIFVKVKVRPDARYDYFMLEDPLPAGCEVITETSGYVIPGENGYGEPSDGYYRYSRPWSWWYADRDVRDEKVAFFAPTIEAREYEFSYIMRAQIPGSYSVMPSVGALMYYPEVRGNSGLVAMTITD